MYNTKKHMDQPAVFHTISFLTLQMSRKPAFSHSLYNLLKQLTACSLKNPQHADAFIRVHKDYITASLSQKLNIHIANDRLNITTLISQL